MIRRPTGGRGRRCGACAGGGARTGARRLARPRQSTRRRHGGSRAGRVRRAGPGPRHSMTRFEGASGKARGQQGRRHPCGTRRLAPAVAAVAAERGCEGAGLLTKDEHSALQALYESCVFVHYSRCSLNANDSLIPAHRGVSRPATVRISGIRPSPDESPLSPLSSEHHEVHPAQPNSDAIPLRSKS